MAAHRPSGSTMGAQRGGAELDDEEDAVTHPARSTALTTVRLAR